MRQGVFVALVWSVLLPSPAAASGLTFIPPGPQIGSAGSPYTYTWQIGGLGSVLPAGHEITGATLFFDDYEGSDPGPRKLFVQLLEGSSSLPMVVGTGSSQTLIRQTIFEALDSSTSALSSRFLFDATSRGVDWWVTDPRTDVSHLPHVPLSTYVYDFTAAQVADLLAYIASGGEIAFALDDTANIFTDGLRLMLQTSPVAAAVPEPATLTLLGVGLLSGLFVRRRWMAKRLHKTQH